MSRLEKLLQQQKEIVAAIEVEIAKEREAASKGHADAQFELGLIYEQGRGLAQDYGEAARCYKQAAEQGIDEAQFRLGWLFEKGLGVTEDFVQALAWYQLSAAQGRASAQCAVGRMYENGRGTKQDFTEAMAAWLSASGYIHSLNNRSSCAKCCTASAMITCSLRRTSANSARSTMLRFSSLTRRANLL